MSNDTKNTPKGFSQELSGQRINLEDHDVENNNPCTIYLYIIPSGFKGQVNYIVEDCLGRLEIGRGTIESIEKLFNIKLS